MGDHNQSHLDKIVNSRRIAIHFYVHNSMVAIIQIYHQINLHIDIILL